MYTRTFEKIGKVQKASAYDNPICCRREKKEGTKARTKMTSLTGAPSAFEGTYLSSPSEMKHKTKKT
jgi:hypothetical protein